MSRCSDVLQSLYVDKNVTETKQASADPNFGVQNTNIAKEEVSVSLICTHANTQQIIVLLGIQLQLHNKCWEVC